MKHLLISILLSFSIAAFCFTDTREKVVESYTAEIGIKEATGSNDGVRVETYLRSTGLGKGYAWCAAFVNYVLDANNVKTPNSAAWSPSWFSSDRVIYKSGKLLTSKYPKPGDVFGIYFTNKKRIAHVGFLHYWGRRYVRTVEGNTNMAGSREGDGVYEKLRQKVQVHSVADWIG